MTDPNLEQLLSKVHERLSRATSIDAEARTLLTTVMQDIERALTGQFADAAPAQHRLESFAVRFEADHPALAQILRQLADTLGKAGI